jgi:hypothetical protein
MAIAVERIMSYLIMIVGLRRIPKYWPCRKLNPEPKPCVDGRRAPLLFRLDAIWNVWREDCQVLCSGIGRNL